MRTGRVAAGAGFWLFVTAAAALGLTTPPPVPRPVAVTAPPLVPPPPIAIPSQASFSAPKPKPRPAQAVWTVTGTLAAIEAGTVRFRTPRPVPRPLADPIMMQVEAAVLAAAMPVRSTKPRPRPVRPTRVLAKPPSASGGLGAICGSDQIIGRPMAPIAGTLPGCGVQNPVQIVEVAGVRLSTGSTMNCATAQALETWVERGVKPTVGRLGGGVAELRVAAHYSCRTRNHQPGAKISEHGKGNAIDISAIELNNGATLSVLTGWGDATAGPILHRVHRAACGPFGTVLGPDADRFHKDHFHFDVARHRGGSYCR